MPVLRPARRSILSSCLRPARRLVRSELGSTLVELLVAMPIAVIVMGIVVQALGVSGTRQQDIERRTEALVQGQIGLERITRELRQAEWVYLRSSGVVELNARVRSSATSYAGRRHVRYDCTGGACMRYEGPPVTYPPSSLATFERSAVIIGADPGDSRSVYGIVVGQDVFRPTSYDRARGRSVPDHNDPDALTVRIRLKVRGREQPVELLDGVSLRNNGAFVR